MIGAVRSRRSAEKRKSIVVQFLKVILDPLIESPLGNALHIDGLRIDDIGNDGDIVSGTLRFGYEQRVTPERVTVPADRDN